MTNQAQNPNTKTIFKMKRKSLVILFFVLVPILLVISGLSFYHRSSSIANTPEVPGSKLKYKVTGAKSVTFYIEVKYEDTPYYDYEYEAEMGDKLKGFLSVSAPPNRTKSQVSITAISEADKRSKPLIFTNEQWWGRVAFFGLFRKYAMSHTFRIL